MTKVHRIVILVVDHDDLGVDEVKVELENVNFPNDCIQAHVMQTNTVEIEWSDDHPLNKRTTQAAEFARMFSGE